MKTDLAHLLTPYHILPLLSPNNRNPISKQRRRTNKLSQLSGDPGHYSRNRNFPPPTWEVGDQKVDCERGSQLKLILFRDIT